MKKWTAIAFVLLMLFVCACAEDAAKEEFYSARSEQIVEDSYQGSLPAFVASFISRRNQPSNSRELRIDTQADKEVGEPTEPEGKAFGCGIYPAAKRAAKKKRTKRGRKSKGCCKNDFFHYCPLYFIFRQ